MATILIIDDEEQVRRYLKKILEKEKHDVFEAPNGRVGTKIFNENNIDLIITDIIMPEKEGIETIMELKREFPEIKIIAISGGSLQMNADDGLCMAKVFGANEVLRKPFTSEALLNAVVKVLQAHR